MPVCHKYFALYAASAKNQYIPFWVQAPYSFDAKLPTAALQFSNPSHLSSGVPASMHNQEYAHLFSISQSALLFCSVLRQPAFEQAPNFPIQLPCYNNQQNILHNVVVQAGFPLSAIATCMIPLLLLKLLLIFPAQDNMQLSLPTML